MYKYFDLDDSVFWPGGELIKNAYGQYEVKVYEMDWTKFCPDGVHPYNPDAINAIAEIYIRELEGIIGSRN